MRIIVQKFGGTSVADRDRRERVVGHICRALNEGLRPIVVVSAMGRSGDPYATDTLLQLVNQDTLSRRELDLLMSCGEVISAVVMADALHARGFDVMVFTGARAGIVTDQRFGQAAILTVRPDALRSALQMGKIPVVAGFQGVTPEGDVTTLGRGGSDTTAAALGAALGAELVEIYSDVDGMKTADPRLLGNAATLSRLNYDEAIELAHLGAKVIHPRAIQIAKEANLPVQVRSTFSDHPGTLILGNDQKPLRSSFTSDRPVTGIAAVVGQTYVRISAEPGRDEKLRFLLDGLAQAGVSLDMIHITQDRVAFAIAGEQTERTEQVLSRLDITYSLDRPFAKVSAVGGGMHGVPGVMARVYRALTQAGVEVYETSDSHANISCLVRETDVERAVRALHEEFQLA